MPALLINGDGRAELMRIEGGRGYARAEQSPGGDLGPWQPLSAGPSLRGRFAVLPTSKGYAAAFARDDRGHVQHLWQTKVGSAWSRWIDLGGRVASDPVAAMDGAGRLGVFARTSEGGLWYATQTQAYGSWTSAAVLPGTIVGTPAVAPTDGGRFEVFARNDDGTLVSARQRADGSFDGWRRVSKVEASIDPRVARAPGGRLRIYWRDAAGAPTVGESQGDGADYAWSRLSLIRSDPLLAAAKGALVVLATDAQGRLQARLLGDRGDTDWAPVE